MALVFQYGSNCSNDVINSPDRLQGDAVFHSIAETVDDYALVFKVFSKNRKCAASNIIEEQGAKVWGVIWDIPDLLISRTTSGERPSLDKIEGEGTNYLRTTIGLRLPSGDVVSAWTYVAKAPKEGLRTNLDYVSHIILGLKEHGVPAAYVEKMKQTAIQSNPDLASEIDAL